MPSAVDTSGRNSPKPAPVKIWHLQEPPFEGFKPIDTRGFQQSNNQTAIVIDNGELERSTTSVKHILIPR
jgi:actin-related protein 5